jgi:hypothetical protein
VKESRSIMFKLGTIKTAETAEIELVDPVTNQPLGWFVVIAGPNHPLHQAKMIERQRRTLLAATLEGKEKAMERSFDEAANVRIEMAVSCVIGWRGLIDDKEKEIPCSPERVRAVLLNVDNAWVIDQISDVLHDKTRFIRRSANV